MKALGRSSSFIFILAVYLATTVTAQTATVIRDAEAAQYVGQTVTVEGTVVAVFTSQKGNTFLNFGAQYPNQTFTGWIPAGTQLASDPALRSLEGKKVRITGEIALYRGRPEIKIVSKEQLAAATFFGLDVRIAIIVAVGLVAVVIFLKYRRKSRNVHDTSPSLSKTNGSGPTEAAFAEKNELGQSNLQTNSPAQLDISPLNLSKSSLSRIKAAAQIEAKEFYPRHQGQKVDSIKYARESALQHSLTDARKAKAYESAFIGAVAQMIAEQSSKEAKSEVEAKVLEVTIESFRKELSSLHSAEEIEDLINLYDQYWCPRELLLAHVPIPGRSQAPADDKGTTIRSGQVEGPPKAKLSASQKRQLTEFIQKCATKNKAPKFSASIPRAIENDTLVFLALSAALFGGYSQQQACSVLEESFQIHPKDIEAALDYFDRLARCRSRRKKKG